MLKGNIIFCSISVLKNIKHLLCFDLFLQVLLYANKCKKKQYVYLKLVHFKTRKWSLNFFRSYISHPAV